VERKPSIGGAIKPNLTWPIAKGVAEFTTLRNL
jgi:hypothetical protein